MLQEQGHCGGLFKIAVGDSADLHGESLPKIGEIETAHEKGLIAQKFRGAVADDLIEELCCIGHLGDQKVTCRNIRRRDADLTGIVEGAEDIVVSALIQGVHIQICTGRHDADHFPAHDPPGAARILHLFADGDLVPQFHKSGQVGVHGVVRDTAHGRALRKPAALSGQCQFQFPGNCHRIVKEHFIKVSETVKKQAVRVFMFCAQIMLHHRRQLRHQGGVFRHFRRRCVFRIIVEIFHSGFLWIFGSLRPWVPFINGSCYIFPLVP